MQKLLIFIIMLCFHQSIMAQKKELSATEKEQEKAINKVAKVAHQLGDTLLLDNYLLNKPLKTNYMYALFLSLKVNMKIDAYWEMKKSPNPNLNQLKMLKNDIVSTYQKAIDTCFECSLAPRFYRASFLSELDKSDATHKKDMQILVAAGYKNPIESIDLNVQYSYSKSGSWIGFGFAPFRFLLPQSTLVQKGENGKLSEPFKVKSKGHSIFPLTYQYNWANQIHDVNVSIYQFDGPLYLNITKFGNWINTKKGQNAYYYRPEIGYDKHFFSINYGYNVQLNHKELTTIDKHIFTARFSFLAFKSYFDKKKSVKKPSYDD